MIAEGLQNWSSKTSSQRPSPSPGPHQLAKLCAVVQYSSIFLPGRHAFVHAFAIQGCSSTDCWVFSFHGKDRIAQWNKVSAAQLSAGWDYGMEEKPGMALQYMSCRLFVEECEEGVKCVTHTPCTGPDHS